MTALLSSSGCALPLGACRIVAGKKERRRRRRSSAVTRGFPLVLIHHAVLVGVNLSNNEDEHNSNHPLEEGDDRVDDAPQEQWILCRTSASVIGEEEPQQFEQEEETCMLELCFSPFITLKGYTKDGDGGDGGQPSSSLLEHLWTATMTRSSSDGVNPRHARTYRTRECPCNHCTKNSNRRNKALQQQYRPSRPQYKDDMMMEGAAAAVLCCCGLNSLYNDCTGILGFDRFLRGEDSPHQMMISSSSPSISVRAERSWVGHHHHHHQSPSLLNPFRVMEELKHNSSMQVSSSSSPCCGSSSSIKDALVRQRIHCSCGASTT